MIEVRSGLRDGERIVVAGAFLLKSELLKSTTPEVEVGAIERFVAAALRQRFFVLLCLAALVATGVAAYRDLPVEAFPDLTNTRSWS